MKHEITYQHNGGDRAATVYVQPGTPHPVVLAYADDQEETRLVDVPLDADYRYTHGGEEYRAAVRAAWAAPWWVQAERSVKEAVS